MVLGQRLGGEQQQGGAAAVLQHRFGYGHLVAERLAGRRAGHHHGVGSDPGPADRLRLVAVESLDAARRQGGRHRRGDGGFRVLVDRPPGRDGLDVGDPGGGLLALDPLGDDVAHRVIVGSPGTGSLVSLAARRPCRHTGSLEGG